MQVRRRLGVDGDVVGAGLGEGRDLALRPLDHHVHVEDAAGAVDLLGERLHDERAHRDRRHEVAVHDVDVDRARAGVHDRGHLVAQAREVGGQDRGRDAVRELHQIGWSIELWQWLQAYRAVLDIRTIVECSPQFGHTDISSNRCRQFTQR